MTSVATLLGPVHAATLSRIAGGTALVVPVDLHASTHNSGALRDRVGDELFALLVFHFGGTRIYVPQATDRRTLKRSAITSGQVDQLTEAGCSAREIALRLKTTERTVYRLRAKTRRLEPTGTTSGTKD